MTIQWNSRSNDGGSLTMNGKHIGANFDASKLKINNTYTPMVGLIGLNNVSTLNGNIAKIIIYNGVDVSDFYVKLHHKTFCM